MKHNGMVMFGNVPISCQFIPDVILLPSNCQITIYVPLRINNGVLRHPTYCTLLPTPPSCPVRVTVIESTRY